MRDTNGNEHNVGDFPRVDPVNDEVSTSEVVAARNEQNGSDVVRDPHPVRVSGEKTPL